MNPPDRNAVQAIVTRCLQDLLAQRGVEPPAPLGPDTAMFGAGGLLDSIGIVTLVVDVEQSLDTECGIQVSLADDRAMSQRNSPYRSVAALTDYILAQAAEGA